MGDARDPYIWAFKPHSRGAFTCPSCGKEMWRYTPPQKFKDFPIFAWGFCVTPAFVKLYEGFKTGA